MKSGISLCIAFLFACLFISGPAKASGTDLFAETAESQEQISQVKLTGLLARKHFGISEVMAGLNKKNSFRETEENTEIILTEALPEIPTSSQVLPDTITSLIRPRPMPAELDQEGRSELIRTSLILSLVYYGWAIPLALDAESGRAYVASYMLVGGGGFFVPFLATRDSRVTEGMARGYTFGSILGIYHGWALAAAIQGDDMEFRLGLGTSVVTSIAEGVTLMNYARSRDLNQGHISMMGTGGVVGLLYGASLPVYFNSESTRSYAVSSLAGSALGYWAGDQLAKKIPLANGDPQIMATTGILGTYLTIALLDGIQPDSEKAIAAMLTAGSAIGLGLGYVKIKALDYSSSNANLIALGTFAGGLIGLGMVYVFAGDAASGNAYLWGSGIGAVAGFAATDLITRNSKSNKLGNLKIQFNPMAVKGMIKPGPANSNLRPNQFAQSQLINASLKF